MSKHSAPRTARRIHSRSPLRRIVSLVTVMFGILVLLSGTASATPGNGQGQTGTSTSNGGNGQSDNANQNPGGHPGDRGCSPYHASTSSDEHATTIGGNENPNCHQDNGGGKGHEEETATPSYSLEVSCPDNNGTVTVNFSFAGLVPDKGYDVTATFAGGATGKHHVIGDAHGKSTESVSTVTTASTGTFTLVSWNGATVLSGPFTGPQCEEPPAPVVCPTVDLTIDMIEIRVYSTTSLSWTTANGPDTLVASGSWNGSKDIPSGTEEITPTSIGNHTYTLTAMNECGSSSDTVTLVVIPAPQTEPEPDTEYDFTSLDYVCVGGLLYEVNASASGFRPNSPVKAFVYTDDDHGSDIVAPSSDADGNVSATVLAGSGNIVSLESGTATFVFDESGPRRVEGMQVEFTFEFDCRIPVTDTPVPPDMTPPVEVPPVTVIGTTPPVVHQPVTHVAMPVPTNGWSMPQYAATGSMAASQDSADDDFNWWALVAYLVGIGAAGLLGRYVSNRIVRTPSRDRAEV